jgi:hypothetical protein
VPIAWFDGSRKRARVGPSFGSQAPPVNSGWNAAGGRRKPIVRGPADPKLCGSHAKARDPHGQGLRGGAVGSQSGFGSIGPGKWGFPIVTGK